MSAPYFAAPALAADDFERVRRRAILHHCKWDPQVGDVSVLGSFPLMMSLDHWLELSELAERLTREALEAERELTFLPKLQRRLGIPRSIRKVLERASDEGPTPAAVRVMRFDFHWCVEGWRISEVNGDVPGGFSEASSFSALMARHYDAALPGSVADAWADAIANDARGGTVALLSAPGYMEDQQIMWYLAGLLRERGSRPLLATPGQVRWRNGRAELDKNGRAVRLESVVRFYQAEWLARLSRRNEWARFFCGGTTRVTNPGTAILLESKRFPLVWDALRTKLPTWRALLPETRDPRDVRWRDSDWVLKAAYGNTGDEVAIRALESAESRRRSLCSVWLRPGDYVAQRLFHALPVSSPAGLVYACIGVYTVDGRTAGAYARISPRPFIDYSAQDVALLVEPGA
jgi:hypothetical protein